MWRIRFRPQARTEIREARSWYEGQLSGLGRAFIAEASWIVFLLLVTLPGYGVAVVALAKASRTFVARYGGRPYDHCYADCRGRELET